MYKQGGDKVAFHLDSRVQLVDLKCSIYSLFKYPLYTRLFKYFSLSRMFQERFREVINDFKPDTISVAIPNAEEFVWEVVRVARNMRVVIESHVAYEYLSYGRSKTDFFLYFFHSPSKAILNSNALIVLTKSDADTWKRKGVQEVLVVPNPVSFYVDNVDNVEKDEKRIISVGRLVSQKRFDRLIDAFALIANHYPGWHIDIFGEGNLRPVLEQQVMEKKLLGRINIHDYTFDVMSEYLRSQFMVLSSDYEGFGLVIVEAMACGLPVISTDCPHGPSEIIDNGVTGWLTRLDVKGLADRMEWMITHQEERQMMGVKAHEAVAAYRKEVIMKKWESAYKPESI
jgi:glycosyltransferase involved in cell wall biosynthesis